MAVRRERPSFERIRSGRFTLPTTQFRSFEGRCTQSETGRSFTAPKRGDRHRLDICYRQESCRSVFWQRSSVHAIRLLPVYDRATVSTQAPIND